MSLVPDPSETSLNETSLKYRHGLRRQGGVSGEGGGGSVTDTRRQRRPPEGLSDTEEGLDTTGTFVFFALRLSWSAGKGGDDTVRPDPVSSFRFREKRGPVEGLPPRRVP